ncbi:MAG: hypothetical protein HC888_05885 [Candidatus Competibacteraceae bacterium]|nr:hypothetical protein [Candidatus Competibacteraceae bacterium]
MAVVRIPTPYVTGSADLLDSQTFLQVLANSGAGNVWFVDPSVSSSGDGRSPDQAFKTLKEAYDAAVDNQHDVIFYLSGTSSLTLTEQLVWAKSYTHLVGIAAPTRAAQRSRIFQSASLTGMAPLIQITAQGCIFSNLYIFQGVNDATSLGCIEVTGGRNYFHNVHFAGGGHASHAIDGGYSLKLNGGVSGSCEENTFDECTIGVDTVDADTGYSAILFDGEAHRNYFNNCVVRLRAKASTGAGAAFAEVADATGIDRDTIFDRCLFLNNSATPLTSGFVIPSGMVPHASCY